ncbi:hypothetical protein EVAR_37838_1 [Eumeta japonica]|uniref:Uncharacterized protein n=1 Tax=Eumeta variegata TaxID=151549 RepID=A0A4C1X463_EUMVA|nr:hypothetical protein EVAR_37838_1 [Eumeta japonica]
MSDVIGVVMSSGTDGLTCAPEYGACGMICQKLRIHKSARPRSEIEPDTASFDGDVSLASALRGAGESAVHLIVATITSTQPHARILHSSDHPDLPPPTAVRKYDEKEKLGKPRLVGQTVVFVPGARSGARPTSARRRGVRWTQMRRAARLASYIFKRVETYHK